MKVCLGPSSASTAIWWCHTVRTQVGLLEPLPNQTSPKHTKLMECADHRITHLQLRGCGGSLLRPSSPGSWGRRAGSASRHPRCPPWRPERCPCLGTRAQPLGSCWRAGLVNRDTQIATPSRTGKPEETIMKPPALHGFCSFSSLGMRMAKQILRPKISNT